MLVAASEPRAERPRQMSQRRVVCNRSATRQRLRAIGRDENNATPDSLRNIARFHRATGNETSERGGVSPPVLGRQPVFQSPGG